MSFSAVETSVESGAPIDLIDFKIENTFYSYTNNTKPVEFDGRIYEPATLDVPKITSTGEVENTEVSVQISSDTTLAKLLVTNSASAEASVIIRQGHLGSAEFPVVWVGAAVGSVNRGNVQTIQCQPSSIRLNRPGLRRNYSRSCPHALYGPSCGASIDAATMTLVPQTFDNNTITFGAGWASESIIPKFIGGVARWDGRHGVVWRSIVSLSEDFQTIGLDDFTTDLKAGEPVKVAFGCNRVLIKDSEGNYTSDCKDLHNNIKNFGGFPWIPNENPLGTGFNVFY